MLPAYDLVDLTPEELAEELDAIQAALEAEFDALEAMERAIREEQAMYADDAELPW